MKKTFSLVIPTPCREKWDEFTPADKGRFCGSCHKIVTDFTTMGEEEIKNYFLKERRNVCGRFNANQLKTYAHTPPKQYHWKLAAVLAFFSLWFVRQSVAQTMGKPVLHEQVDEPKKISGQANAVYVSLTMMGVVRDSTFNNPVSGATIIRKGSVEQTVTDSEGKFQLIMLKVKPEEYLEVSVKGYKTQTITVKPGNPYVNIFLKTEPEVISRAISEMTCQTVVLGGAIASYRVTPRTLWWRVKNVFRK